MKRTIFVSVPLLALILIGFIGCNKNNPPDTPTVVSPADGATNVSVQNLSLKWLCGDPNNDALIYHVYFGSSNPPSFVKSTSQNSYSVSSASYSKTYYWQIVASDGKDSTEGPIWSFTTGEKPNSPPYTPDSLSYYTEFDQTALSVSVEVNGTIPEDPDGDSLYYNVDFGDGNSTGWKGPYTTGTTITEDHIYTSPSEDTGAVYMLTWQVKDTHGNLSSVSSGDSMVMPYFGEKDWLNQELSGGYNIDYTLPLNNNNLVYRVKLDVNNGSSVNVTLHDPLAYQPLSYSNIVHVDTSWFDFNSSNSWGVFPAGDWKLNVSKTLGTAHYNVYMYYMQFPPSIVVSTANKWYKLGKNFIN